MQPPHERKLEDFGVLPPFLHRLLKAGARKSNFFQGFGYKNNARGENCCSNINLLLPEPLDFHCRDNRAQAFFTSLSSVVLKVNREPAPLAGARDQL
jgi:hypothetical protein